MFCRLFRTQKQRVKWGSSKIAFKEIPSTNYTQDSVNLAATAATPTLTNYFSGGNAIVTVEIMPLTLIQSRCQPSRDLWDEVEQDVCCMNVFSGS